MVLYLGFTRMRPETWAVLYWVVMLFIGIGATVGDYRAEGISEKFFYHQLSDPISIYLSRIVFNTTFLFILSLILYIIFGIFFGWEVPFQLHVPGILLLGCFSLSLVFCFVSILVFSAGRGSTLASLLGFPLVIPVLLLLIRLFYSQMSLIEADTLWADVFSLLGIDAVLLGLGMILFPLIWRS
jgi:heme exporter protein B